MTTERVKSFLKSKERRHPRTVAALRTLTRTLRRKSATYPRILGREIDAVKNVLQTSNWNMTYGGDLAHQQLEEEFAAYIGTRSAVAVNTGGMALQMVMRALGVKPGDEVIHQVDTCVADAFAVLAAGGTPILADINPQDFMICADTVAQHLNESTRAVIAIHMWGNPGDMDSILQFTNSRKVPVIEDACLSLGAVSRGRKVGSLADAAVFSFGCLKPIQTGEGGMITTDDEALAKELRTIRNWGDMSAEYGIRDQRALSWNGRMSEIVAAVGLEQLRGYPAYLAKLRELVGEFLSRVTRYEGLEVAVPESTELIPSYSQVVMRLDEDAAGISKIELMRGLTDRGIEVWHANFEPINQLSFFKEGLWRDWVLRGDIERAERNYRGPFVNSEKAYAHTGLGFSRSNFSSRATVDRLVTELDRTLKARVR